jgi:hypothetical protein
MQKRLKLKKALLKVLNKGCKKFADSLPLLVAQSKVFFKTSLG